MILDNKNLEDFIMYQTSWIALGCHLLTSSQWEKILILQKMTIAFSIAKTCVGAKKG